jgi:CRP/FNR family transcriptional regulator, cyclic AMP receptor protein
VGIRLLEADPSFAQFLSEEERADARRIVLPVERISRGIVDVCGLLEKADAFAGLILEGILLQRTRIGEQVAVRLLGPGDVSSLTKQSRSMLISDSDCRVLEDARMALLGREMLVGARHWPPLVSGLHVRIAEQTDRLTAQLVICQLPRVDQRLIAIMWLLAESWGRVTPMGTSLPMHLTHDVLGGLVGARRSTVTLALKELADRGALIRQPEGWLILEAPDGRPGGLPEIEEPRLSRNGISVWQQAAPENGGEAASGAELLERVERLREEHAVRRSQVQAQLDRLALARKRRDELGGTSKQSVRRRPAPS